MRVRTYVVGVKNTCEKRFINILNYNNLMVHKF